MKNKILSLATLLTACLVNMAVPARAQLTARQILDKARDYEAAAPLLQRVDASEQSTVAVIGQQRIPQLPQTNLVKIEIDRARELARQSSSVEGKDVVMLRQGSKSAMRIGDGSWEAPAGNYQNIAKELGNLFVCEQETPESGQNAPVWTVVGTERVDGVDAFVIETEGNSAAPIARARMKKGMAKVLPAGSSAPEVTVLRYSSKHWISKADYRPLRVEQNSSYQVALALPGGQKPVVETTGVTTSVYRFENVAIFVPQEARRFLLFQR